MGLVKVSNIRVYAHHGCLGEETIIGSDYRVDVAVSANLKSASVSDQLSETVDYVHINRLVKEEMAIPSKLLEHVAQRIINRILDEIEIVKRVKVGVTKMNPPIGGDVEGVTIVLKSKR
ncbi:dihydroneopterin aldolase [Arenibacter certesii]|uniref:7,8-dihydroneopterin aldolase n=1 Tax=Arenibacter certesii TaxID=228955 RepID=A0A918MNC0_9FLAO|nr:dihydroneopterin aldolase [Arenibacter certesii]GGW39013.1 7,8-dihydroneopterin aldolase [Arenibacter certesii]